MARPRVLVRAEAARSSGRGGAGTAGERRGHAGVAAAGGTAALWACGLRVWTGSAGRAAAPRRAVRPSRPGAASVVRACTWARARAAGAMARARVAREGGARGRAGRERLGAGRRDGEGREEGERGGREKRKEKEKWKKRKEKKEKRKWKNRKGKRKRREREREEDGGIRAGDAELGRPRGAPSMCGRDARVKGNRVMDSVVGVRSFRDREFGRNRENSRKVRVRVLWKTLTQQ